MEVKQVASVCTKSKKLNVPVTEGSPVDDIGETDKVEAAVDVEPAIVELGVVAVTAVLGFWAAEVV